MRSMISLALTLLFAVSLARSLILEIPSNNSLLGHSTWKNFVDNSQVVKIELGCGRMQNRMLTFSDGTRACARYRFNANQMQGEIYSYVVAQLLNITNLPALTTALPNVKTNTWHRVAPQVVEAGWSPDKLITITQYVPEVQDTFLPEPLRQGLVSGMPQPVTLTEQANMLQWSDMIIFDYLIGNMDRLVNSLHNKQWNENILDSPVHNLGSSFSTLIFYDNEDGLFHGYKIMNRFSKYHETSLKSLCIFRRGTVEAIRRILASDDYHDLERQMNKYIELLEPQALKYLPKVSPSVYKTMFQRFQSILTHLNMCDTLHEGL